LGNFSIFINGVLQLLYIETLTPHHMPYAAQLQQQVEHCACYVNLCHAWQVINLGSIAQAARQKLYQA